MSADLFAAFINDSNEDSSSKFNVTAQKQSVASDSWSDAFTSTVATSIHNTVERKQRDNHAPPLWQKDRRGTDILFDAEAADEDDFGDFEDVNTVNTIKKFPEVTGDNEGHRMPSLKVADQHPPDLISLEPEFTGLVTGPSTSDPFKRQEVPEISTSGQHGIEEPGAAWDDDWGDFEQTSPKVKPSVQIRQHGVLDKAANINPPTTEEAEDYWEPFEDGQPQQPQGQKSTSVQPSSELSMTGKAIKPISTDAVTRPLNVPPPATLLQLLSNIFVLIHNLHSAGQEAKPDLALKVLVVFRVVSRIVAGRTLRWKRDTILAQSMRIGQAGSTGGMKLTSVNKGESTREAREVEDLLGHWSRYTHEFHSILAQAGMTGTRLKIASSPTLKILKATGTSKQCALCGLQRTERISGVDTDIDDLFGEFWTEHWGHKECCEFWFLYKEHLNQR
ncbi:hypothetical protein LTR84_007218 [Exophiala bonariae]|uniref:Uncharacterized protein n=1 Tax=Exophiala bonariae TaxID=1690606 RepID=A0AAV9N1U1_9EURO|nr:hypothetical protein LTR84_007218 [Exophiala bonariae]